MGLPIITSPVNSFNPCTVIVCYAIIFIMSAQGNLNDSIVLEGCDGPTEELLGNLMTGGEKEPLLSKFSCGGRPCDSVILHHGSANDGSHPSSQRMMEKPLPIAKKDCVTLNDDLGSTQQQLRTSTPVLEKLGHSDRLKDKPFQNVFTALPLLAPTSKQIRNEVCRKQSQIFVHHLMRYKFWALQMYDSSAKLPSGILRGNVNQLGDFDQCLAVGKHEAPGIDGKYCLASVDVESTTLKTNDADSLEKAVQLAQSYGLIRSSYRDPGHFIPRFTTIKWALCVPASCSSADVHQTLMEALRNYNETIGLIFDVHVDPEMCYVKQKPGSPLGAPTVFTLCVLFSLVLH